MSAICRTLESATLKALLQLCSNEASVDTFTRQTEAEGATIVPTGLHIVTGYAEFDLNLYTSSSNEEQELPALNVICTAAAVIPEAPMIQTLDLEISVRLPVDDNATTADATEAMHGLSMWLEDIANQPAVMRDALEQADGSLVISGIYQKDRNSGVISDKRVQYSVIRFNVTAALSN